MLPSPVQGGLSRFYGLPLCILVTAFMYIASAEAAWDHRARLQQETKKMFYPAWVSKEGRERGRHAHERRDWPSLHA